MGALDEAVTRIAAQNLAESSSPKRGTLLFCSSPKGSTSIGPPNAARTLFTGALLHLLQQGVAFRHKPMLSFADVATDVYQTMLELRGGGSNVPRPALHQPNQLDGDLTQLPAFPNVRDYERQEAERLAKERRAAEASQREEERRADEVKHLEEELHLAEARLRDHQLRAAEARRLAEKQHADEITHTSEI